MPAVPLSDAVADAVVSALNGADLTYQSAPVVFTKARWPKYALRDLGSPKFHVVPMWPASMRRLDDGGTGTDTPIAVTIDAAAEKRAEKVAELTGLLESIAAFLAGKRIAGAGYPIEDLVIDRNEDMLDAGHFCGGVGVPYRVFRDNPEDDDE